MKRSLVLLLALVIMPNVFALEGHMPLLAVRDIEDGKVEGSNADLFLEIIPGKGRVFLETYPLTKADTQISMRFAKEVACSHIDADCSKYDFIYRIQAKSPIIAGPSAGLASALLTISALEGSQFEEGITATGTINSGGFVGNVGGIKEKIQAASERGLKKVLIPKGERNVSVKITEIIRKIRRDPLIIVVNETSGIGNETMVDVVEYGEKLNITVIEVAGLDEALYYLTGREIPDNGKIDVDTGYSSTMKILAEDLCARSSNLKRSFDGIENKSDIYNVKLESDNLTNEGLKAIDEGMFYSAGSFCFGANVRYSFAKLSMENLSKEKISERADNVIESIEAFENEIDAKEKKTITDLEAYMAVKERLNEAKSLAEKTKDVLNGTGQSSYLLAFANERLKSASSWAEFFDHRGKELELDNESLRQSCQDKLNEAEERYQYVLLFIPTALERAREDKDRAYSYFENQSYELCLFEASKAKSQADVVLSVVGVESGQLDELLDQKLSAVRKVLAKQQKNEIFPILGYSYYEYSQALSKDDKISALLYAEYGLELSNLDLYFKPKEKPLLKKSIDAIKKNPYAFLAIGIAIGFIASLGFLKFYTRKPVKKFR